MGPVIMRPHLFSLYMYYSLFVFPSPHVPMSMSR
jgi:hypothetical protein